MKRLLIALTASTACLASLTLAAPPAPPPATAPKPAAAKPAAAPAAAPAARPAVAAAPGKFNLKPGAKGAACLRCHAAFQDTLKQPFVHTPVKAGDCADCHNPHASDHGKLLADEADRICTTCHAAVVPDNAKSSHPDVLKGNCTKCHDPHAAKNKNNLLKAGNELCFECHKDLAKSIQAAKFKHSPVSKSCLSCHDPHAGLSTDNLLAKQSPALCLDCHKPDQPTFQKAHLNYPVAKSDCASCHNPHGSDQPSILWATVHPPVRSKMCAQCHYEASSPDALKTKKAGIDACRACHSETINAAFNLSRLHWPVADRTACLNCHMPHAARAPKLLRQSEGVLCGRCHADAVARQAKSVTKHQPIADGECTTCHKPHSSNSVYLLEGNAITDVCGKCHDWGKHSAHPSGPKVIDPRNKNLSVDCLACHRTHGTPVKHLAHFETKKELCVQCHTSMGN